jgi:hypothetical protein
MPLLNVVVALIVVGVALWLINSFIPMASSIKAILNVVVVVAVGVWVLQAVGLWGQISSYPHHPLGRSRRLDSSDGFLVGQADGWRRRGAGVV